MSLRRILGSGLGAGLARAAGNTPLAGRFLAAAPQEVSSLEQFVKQVEKEALEAKKKQYQADLSSGARDKEHDQFWAAQRAKYESWDAEAAKANVDPLIYTAVKEMEAVEGFKAAVEAIETPSSSNGGGVASFVKSVLSLKDKHGILQRWHQVAFQRELLVRNAQDSVRKFKAQAEPHLLPEAYTAFSRALDQAESKLGKPVLFSSEEGMKALSAELAKTGLWESLGVDEKGSLLKQYEQEEVELCTDRLKEIEDERKRAVEAFAGTLGH